LEGPSTPIERDDLGQPVSTPQQAWHGITSNTVQFVFLGGPGRCSPRYLARESASVTVDPGLRRSGSHSIRRHPDHYVPAVTSSGPCASFRRLPSELLGSSGSPVTSLSVLIDTVGPVWPDKLTSPPSRGRPLPSAPASLSHGSAKAVRASSG
jgi:hypothetical protein